MRKYAGPYETELRPDADMVLAQMLHWFGDQMSGQIDIGYVCVADGKLNKFRRFELYQLEELAEFVVEVNRIPGQSVYFRPALIRPDAPRFVTDQDFLRSTGIWIDLDDAGVAEQAPTIYSTTRPTMVVVTGRHPHLRVQLFYRASEEIGSPGHLRDLNRRAAALLHGDTLVINPTSLMRVGGTIAWPWKDGRRIEMTELRLYPDRKQSYPLLALGRAFPPVAEHEQPTAAEDEPASVGDLLNLSPRKIMERIRAGEHWHNNMLRLVGHWINRGWQDEEILTASEAMTLAGYTRQQTRHEVAQMIRTGRQKWNMPEPEVTAGTSSEQKTLRLTDWTADIYSGEPEPITWLCDGTIPLGVPVLVAAKGGVGKSYLALDLALEIATGGAGRLHPKVIFGGAVLAQGAAVMLTAEEGQNAVHRRLAKADPDGRRFAAADRLIVVPLPDAGGTQPLIRSGRDGPVQTEAFLDLKRQLAEIPNLRLIVIDPLQAFVMADVTSDPAAGQYMWSAFAEICADTGATLMVLHHMRKDGSGSIETAEQARETIRGSTALVDGARLAYALWEAPEHQARGACAQLDVPFDAKRIVNGAVVKANDETDWGVQTYLRAESGLLEDRTARVNMSARKTAPTMEEARALLSEIDKRWQAGNPFSQASNTGPRYLPRYIAKAAGIDHRSAETVMADWFENEIVEEALVDTHTKRRGLRVKTWLR